MMHVESEDLGSTIERGDLRFAGYHEAVDRRSPDRVLAARELLKAQEEKERAWDKLQEAYQAGASQAKLDRLERAYAEIQERVRRMEDGSDDWQEHDSERISLAEAIGRGMEQQRAEQRLEDFDVLLRYVFQDGVANPWLAFKNLCALTRRCRPDLLGDLTQREMAVILGEGNGAVQARERRIFEEIQVRWGIRGFQGLGGTKSAESRKKYAAVQQGNSNRKKGAAAKHKAIVTAGKGKPKKGAKS